MILVYDRLAKVLYDESRDCEYPPWLCMNDKDIAKRVITSGAIENVFAINASAKINDTIARSLQIGLNSNMVELLVDFDEIEDVITNNIPEYETGDIDVQIFYERPFLETKALINEMISLQYVKNEQSGLVTLYETGSNTKDRYISVAYGNYYVDLIERDLISLVDEYEFACFVD